MKKAYIYSEDVLELDQTLSPKREVYVDSLEDVKLKVSLQKAKALKIFHHMPDITLPPLPWGYLWVRHDEEHCIVKDIRAPDYKLHLVLYGPNDDKQINFLFQENGTTTYSFAHIQKSASPTRTYPMTSTDYRVPGFDYSTVKYNQHVRGHLIDLRDSIQVGQRETWSAYDPRNFVPEPPTYEWGLGIRNQKVQALRRMKEQTAYAQHTIYPDEPMETVNRTFVPDEVYFTSYTVTGKKNNKYKRLDSINVCWDENMKRPRGQKVLEHASKQLTTSLEASPVVQSYEPDSPDRTLRYQSREYNKTANRIVKGDVKFRFWSSELFQRYGAADREFEHSNHKFRAGITADEIGRTPDAIDNVTRALDFADDLNQLDDNRPIISNKVIKQGKAFVKTKHHDDDWVEQDLDDITDRLRYFSTS